MFKDNSGGSALSLNLWNANLFSRRWPRAFCPLAGPHRGLWLHWNKWQRPGTSLWAGLHGGEEIGERSVRVHPSRLSALLIDAWATGGRLSDCWTGPGWLMWRTIGRLCECHKHTLTHTPLWGRRRKYGEWRGAWFHYTKHCEWIGGAGCSPLASWHSRLIDKAVRSMDQTDSRIPTLCLWFRQQQMSSGKQTCMRFAALRCFHENACGLCELRWRMQSV